MDAFAERIHGGFLYGDFRLAIDPASDDFLHKGVFSCYRPVDPATPMPADEKSLSDESWRTLLYLAQEPTRRRPSTATPTTTSRPTASSIGRTPTR